MEIVHARYKDLAQVEWAFRTAKTAHLEMRPIHVRRESRTRGHAFVVMLAYRLIQELAARWSHLNLTVQEGIDQLASLCLVEVTVNGQVALQQNPRTQCRRSIPAGQRPRESAFRSARQEAQSLH